MRWSNNSAYLIARSDELRTRELQAFEHARYALKWAKDDYRKCTRVGPDPEILVEKERVNAVAQDTFAYLVLVSELAARKPNLDRIACAYEIFERQRQAKDHRLHHVAGSDFIKSGGRLEFERARVSLNITQAHLHLAAQALAQKSAKCPSEVLQNFSEGKL